jgi:uncharacterized membrane protein
MFTNGKRHNIDGRCGSLCEVSANFDIVFFIGPIPIVLGAGPEAAWMVLLAIIIAVVSIMMFLIMHREIGKEKA